MKEIVLATRNKHKIEEMNLMLKDLGINVLYLDSFGNLPEVIEDRMTLEGNAIKKASEIAKQIKKWTLADDTGLEVDFLDGAPGVYSARFAGPECSYERNRKKLLSLLKDIPKEKRNARFRCVIALSDPEGNTKIVEGITEGIILKELRGDSEFGYDPIFYVPSCKKTFGELSSEEKNKISHRGNAIREVKKLIRNILREL
jgi:XTP/dITP diphosphohydrolase